MVFTVVLLEPSELRLSRSKFADERSDDLRQEFITGKPKTGNSERPIMASPMGRSEKLPRAYSVPPRFQVMLCPFPAPKRLQSVLSPTRIGEDWTPVARCSIHPEELFPQAQSVPSLFRATV